MSTDVSQIGLGFLEGLALIASPCILPVLPIVLATGAHGSRLRPYGVILGFVLSFTAFTLFARQLVGSLGLDPGLIRQASFILLLVMGMVMLSDRLSEGFAHLTQSIGQWGSDVNRRIETHNELLTGLLIGMCIGLIWVPCSGPILAAVLVQSIQQHTTLSGLFIVFAFALGAGLPMLLLALLGNRLASRLNVVKRNAYWLRKMTAVIILATVLFTGWDSFAPVSFGATPFSQPSVKLEDGLESPYPAPELTGIQGWINTKPFRLADLKGKVVLVDFWTYSCINCIRTLPYVTAWDARYRKDGLVIVGIHAPEFEFERKQANVERAVQQRGIHYPVVLDNQLATWTAFQNHYWPAHYLINKQGQVVYTHFGEGNYERTEHNIQALLHDKGPMAKVTQKSGSTPALGQTPETYLGYARAESFASKESVHPNQGFPYHHVESLPVDHWSLQGPWQVGAEQVKALASGSSLRLNFRAKEVYLVLGAPKGKSIPVNIQLNGKSMDKPFVVNGHSLYTVLKLPTVQRGLLELQTTQPGLEAYAFTFGS